MSSSPGAPLTPHQGHCRAMSPWPGPARSKEISMCVLCYKIMGGSTTSNSNDNRIEIWLIHSRSVWRRYSICFALSLSLIVYRQWPTLWWSKWPCILHPTAVESLDINRIIGADLPKTWVQVFSTFLLSSIFSFSFLLPSTIPLFFLLFHPISLPQIPPTKCGPGISPGHFGKFRRILLYLGYIKTHSESSKWRRIVFDDLGAPEQQYQIRMNKFKNSATRPFTVSCFKFAVIISNCNASV